MNEEIYVTKNAYALIGSGREIITIAAKGKDHRWYADTFLSGPSAENFQQSINRNNHPNNIADYLDNNQDSIRCLSLDNINLHLVSSIDSSARKEINRFIDFYVSNNRKHYLN